MSRPFRPSRRDVIAGGAATLLLAGQPPAAGAEATPLAQLIARVTEGAVPMRGRIALELPRISENGNAVPIGITVESPMTPADHVRWIHIIAGKNPDPDVARFHLGPRAGRAKVATTIRLASTQKITVVAATSDGAYWAGDQEVVVTVTACIDGGE